MADPRTSESRRKPPETNPRLSSSSSLLLVLGLILAATLAPSAQNPAAERERIRVGIIGLDTSHAPAFTELMNSPDLGQDPPQCRVTVAYPWGSSQIESSATRIPEYTARMKSLGIDIADTIPELLDRVDAVMLLTNDGNLHFNQALEVLKSGKRLFIDKPLAASLVECVAIFRASERYRVPLFSSSSLRFSTAVQATRQGANGRVLGCDTYSPATLEASHPDLFWYGIHGVETLFTVMGTGCRTVTRVYSEGTDFVVGIWDDGRIGSFRGTREGKHLYGGTAFTSEGVSPLPYDGYQPMIQEIARFFRTGIVPIEPKETLEIYAFMVAAKKSKTLGGVPVEIGQVLREAEAEARKISLE